MLLEALLVDLLVRLRLDELLLFPLLCDVTEEFNGTSSASARSSATGEVDATSGTGGAEGIHGSGGVDAFGVDDVDAGACAVGTGTVAVCSSVWLVGAALAASCEVATALSSKRAAISGALIIPRLSDLLLVSEHTFASGLGLDTGISTLVGSAASGASASPLGANAAFNLLFALRSQS